MDKTYFRPISWQVRHEAPEILIHWDIHGAPASKFVLLGINHTLGTYPKIVFAED